MADPSEQAAITATPMENEIAMRGDGNYNENSAMQHMAIMPALEFIPNLSNRKLSICSPSLEDPRHPLPAKLLVSSL
jgi:hypothetical protein